MLRSMSRRGNVCPRELDFRFGASSREGRHSESFEHDGVGEVETAHFGQKLR